MQTIFMVLFLITSVILSMLVLIQRGRGGGLAGAFGGAGGSSAFGTKTADIFIKATAVLGGIFFLLAIGTAIAVIAHGSLRTPLVGVAGIGWFSSGQPDIRPARRLTRRVWRAGAWLQQHSGVTAK